MAVSGFLFINDNSNDSHEKSHELMDALFGGELLSKNTNLTFLILLIILVLFMIKYRFRHWLLLIINEDLAKIKKLNTKQLSFEYKLIVGIIVGIAIKLYGILLTGGLLIIPAATAIYLSKTYKQIVIYSIAIVLFSNIFCYSITNVRYLVLSKFYDNENAAGLIIVLNFSIFIIVKLFSNKKNIIMRNK
jgi:ABC-type Mn2+/Zn2+ transport system permease subunit